ncbi:MAG: helix-turn-helix domain-containing protein, partial [Gemmatimonadales bacterium]
MPGNGPAWFGGGPHGKGVPSRKPPRRAAYPVNAHGLSVLEPHWGAGRPPRITDQDEAFVVEIA